MCGPGRLTGKADQDGDIVLYDLGRYRSNAENRQKRVVVSSSGAQSVLTKQLEKEGETTANFQILIFATFR